MTKSPSTTIDEIASTMSAAAAHAMKGLRDISDGLVELRQIEMMLKGLAASRTIASEKRGPRACVGLTARVDLLHFGKAERL